MARTLGSEAADQVTGAGRRILIGWVGPGDDVDGIYDGRKGSAQSLPRELSLAPDRSLSQAFVPELAALRGRGQRAAGAAAEAPIHAGLQAEVLAFLPEGCAQPCGACGLRVLGDGENGTTITLDVAKGLVVVDATSQRNNAVRGGPLPPVNARGGYELHVYVDHAIVELIVNNATALVVYAAPSSAAAGDVALFGLPAADGVMGAAELQAWPLASPKHALS